MVIFPAMFLGDDVDPVIGPGHAVFQDIAGQAGGFGLILPERPLVQVVQQEKSPQGQDDD